MYIYKSQREKRSCPRGEMGATYEENDERRKNVLKEQGIFLTLKELNITVSDHMYLELYKQKEDEKEKPDLSTKNRTSMLPMASTPKVAKVFRLQVTPEAASSFISPSKSRGKGYYLKKAIEKATNEKVCRIGGKSTKIPWLGCNFEENGKYCEYWLHAHCYGFADATDYTFEHIGFQCPTHRGKHPKVVKDNIWK